MKIFLANPPWYSKPEQNKPGWYGVRAGSRWPHTFPYLQHNEIGNEILELKSGYKPFPFWLATATAMLKKIPSFDVYLRDSIARAETYESFYAAFGQISPDVVLIETASATLEHDLSIINRLRELKSNLIVILAGLHIELDSPEFLEGHDQINYVLYGEYELSLVALLESIKENKDFDSVPGLIYRTAFGQIKKNEFVIGRTVEEFPWPFREPSVIHAYNDTASGLPMPQLQIMATRGCPYGCIFCIWPQMFYRSGKYRKRTINDVVNEIELNMQEGNYASFYLDDDTFNINGKYVVELASEIVSRGLNKYPWSAMGRADLIDKEQVEALAKAGLYSVKYGVESADQTVLNSSGKHISIEKVIKGIKLTHDAGIKVHLTFTIGLPNDTHETILKTIDLACELPCESVQFSIATPYPGTSMYDIYKKEGWLVSDRWSDYVGSTHAVSKTETLTPQDLEYYQKLALERYADADAKRKLTSELFIYELNKRLNSVNSEKPILVLQSARIAFTKTLIQLIQKNGKNVHVLSHSRFTGQFKNILNVTEIHEFDHVDNFDYAALKNICIKLVGSFSGVIIPYSHRFGSGYSEVEKIADLISEGNVLAGINLDGDFIR